MLASALLAAAFQVGPFYEQRPADDYLAVRPFYAHEGETDDVLWPVFTSHRDWWRFCFFMHYQEQDDGGWQFDLLPFWFNGHLPARGEDRAEQDYWGLFPIYGHHPSFALMHDIDFVMWPVWMRYRMPRPSERKWMTTNAVLFPFVSWRDDGSWGLWPVYGINHQRESDHQYALWPLVTWANYRRNRDSAGEGSSWMVWPLVGRVDRERESQWLFAPPLFSYAEVRNQGGAGEPGWRLRCPWPFVDIESTSSRDRISVWPLYERVTLKSYGDGDDGEDAVSSSVMRFGWKLVELYDDETRVFPFWTSRKDDSYFRLWPFWESETKDGTTKSRLLALFPIRWVPSVERSWSKFWTFYERESNPVYTDHSFLWGIIRWRTAR